MNLLHRVDHRHAPSRPSHRLTPAAAETAATLVSTHLREERIELPRRPTLVHQPLLRFDRLSALSAPDDNDNNQLTPSAGATPPDVLLNPVHHIPSRHPP